MSNLSKPTMCLLVAAAALCGCSQGPSEAPTAGPAAPAAAQRPPLTVVERIATSDGTVVAKLSNGLTVILKATRSNPVVCVRAYVRAGGLYERQWLGCGICHLTEHLVAKGAVHDMGPDATAAEARQSSDRVTLIGGQSNAYTSLGHTCYYISATAEKTDDCVDLVADWLARADIPPEDFRREHGVVQRELEMGKDKPERQLWQAHMANVFGTHPAAVPIIGFAEPLARLTRADVLEYHRRMYVPQHMVFCVVGDIDPQAVLDRTCRAFAGMESGRPADLSLPQVAPIWSVRRVTRSHGEIRDVRQMMSFQTIPLLHDDLYALDVLSYVLTQGRASRLVERIERQQKLVLAVDSSSWTPQWSKGVFTISFRAESEKADEAERAILAELKRIADEGVADEELDRAKRQKIADLVYSQQSVEAISTQLATDYLATGDVAFSRQYTDRIQKVTAQEVRDAARKYFAFERMAVTRMIPAGEAPASAATTQPPDQAEASMLTLPNGLRVVLMPDNSIDLVSMTFVCAGGVLAETPETNGLGAFMTAMTTKGAGDRSAEQIARFFDAAGGSIAGRCGNNSFYWQLSVLKDGFAEALEILADVVQRPTFASGEMEILRPKLLSAVDKNDEEWFGRLQKFFRRKFFPASPYGMLAIGDKAVLAAVTPGQLADHHSRYIRAEAGVLAICGNFDPPAAASRALRLFADLPAGKADLPEPAPRRVETTGELHVLRTNHEVAGIILAAPGMRLADIDDRLAITVLDTIISGYRLPSGWLHTELRGKQLVYVVHAYNWAGLAPGAFVTYAATQPPKAPQVVEIIRRNLREAAAYRPTQEQIDQAVNVILTAELLGNQAASDLSMAAALDELYGFGYDFRRKLAARYAQVTPDDVAAVGAKYLGGGLVTIATTPQPELFESHAADRDNPQQDR